MKFANLTLILHSHRILTAFYVLEHDTFNIYHLEHDIFNIYHLEYATSLKSLHMYQCYDTDMRLKSSHDLVSIFTRPLESHNIPSNFPPPEQAIVRNFLVAATWTTSGRAAFEYHCCLHNENLIIIFKDLE